MRKIKSIAKKVYTTVITVVTAVTVIGNPIQVRAAEDNSQYDFSTGQLDPVFYAAMYPDVAAVVGTDPLALFQHYAEHGIFEGRIPYAGAEPGEFINGYAMVGIIPELAANATLVDQNDGSATTVTRDLSDWTPAQLVALAQKQAEFDASGLVHVGWTEQQVYDRLMWIKANLYPEGSYGSICEVGAGRIGAALYGRDMDWMMGFDEDVIWTDRAGNRVMPVGFVERKEKSRENGNIKDVRIGDVIYTKGTGTGHVMTVLSHDEKGITVVESNRNGDEKFHWGRRISWNELENGGKTIYQQQNKWTDIVHRMY